jgi:hypothetical protein
VQSIKVFHGAGTKIHQDKSKCHMVRRTKKVAGVTEDMYVEQTVIGEKNRVSIGSTRRR